MSPTQTDYIEVGQNTNSGNVLCNIYIHVLMKKLIPQNTIFLKVCLYYEDKYE